MLPYNHTGKLAAGLTTRGKSIAPIFLYCCFRASELKTLALVDTSCIDFMYIILRTCSFYNSRTCYCYHK